MIRPIRREINGVDADGAIKKPGLPRGKAGPKVARSQFKTLGDL